MLKIKYDLVDKDRDFYLVQPIYPLTPLPDFDNFIQKMLNEINLQNVEYNKFSLENLSSCLIKITLVFFPSYKFAMSIYLIII